MTFKKYVNLSLPGISNNHGKKIIKNRFKNTSQIQNLNSKQNNSIDSISNKKESKKNDVFTKSKIFGYSTEKTDYSSIFNDKNASKIKTNNNSKQIFLDIKVNKTIQCDHRNKKIFATEFQKTYSPINNLNNYYPINTITNSNKYSENFKNIHKIELDKILSFTNNIFYSKTSQKNGETSENKYNVEGKRTKNNKFNSLNHFIDDYMLKNDDDIIKYKINFRDYFGDSDYVKLKDKQETYLTEINKIKLLYKNTNLMKALCDYLNLSFVKLKNEKKERTKIIKQEKEELKKKKKYLKILQKNWEHNLIPIRDIFNINQKFNLKHTANNRNYYSLRKNFFIKHKIY